MADNLKDLEGMHTIMKEFHGISKLSRTVLLNMLAKEHETIGDLIEDPYCQIRKDYLAAGGRGGHNPIIPGSNNRIQTIKLVRQQGRLSLKEAKELVESW